MDADASASVLNVANVSSSGVPGGALDGAAHAVEGHGRSRVEAARNSSATACAEGPGRRADQLAELEVGRAELVEGSPEPAADVLLSIGRSSTFATATGPRWRANVAAVTALRSTRLRGDVARSSIGTGGS